MDTPLHPHLLHLFLSEKFLFCRLLGLFLPPDVHLRVETVRPVLLGCSEVAARKFQRAGRCLQVTFPRLGCENSCDCESGGGAFVCSHLTRLCAPPPSVCLIGNCESESATTNYGA